MKGPGKKIGDKGIYQKPRKENRWLREEYQRLREVCQRLREECLMLREELKAQGRI